MEALITKLYRPQGIATTNFEPVHSKGLSNEFFCYANFECEQWKWRVEKDGLSWIPFLVYSFLSAVGIVGFYVQKSNKNAGKCLT